MLETPLVEYHFESYKTSNGTKGIKLSISGEKSYELNLVPNNASESGLKIDSSSAFSNFTEKAGCFSWDSYGTSFKLTAEGDLTLIKVSAEYEPRFKINGANIVKLGGLNFKQLHIKSKEVQFNEDFSASDLELCATSMLNNKFVNAETAKFAVTNITNHGEVCVLKTGEVQASTFDNKKGQFHCGGEARLTAAQFYNEDGSFNGANGTKVEIGNTFTSNEKSQIGVGDLNRGGTTEITFKAKLTLNHLGTVSGKTVIINNTPTLNGNGVIVGGTEVALHNSGSVTMPNVSIKTPVLKLHTPDFKLKDQADCERTILQVAANRSVRLNNEYRTSGTFEIHEIGVTTTNIDQAMLSRFGAISNYNLATMPYAKYNIAIPEAIQANKGFLFLTPNAKISLGNEHNPSKHPVLQGEFGELKVYATEFDIEKGGVATTGLFAWTPRGFPLGRLIEDPSRQVFATHYANAHRIYSSSLGWHIKQTSYMFLGRNVSIYDGRHLLIMPVAISNNSFLQIKGSIKVIGQFHNKGTLATKTLEIDSSSGPSVWEVGVAAVENDCHLTGNFTFKRITTPFKFEYYSSDRWWDYTYDTCNSDPAQLSIQGKLSGKAIINNEGSCLHATEKAAEVQVNSKDFTAYLEQQFIGGSLEERQSLSNAVDRSGRTVHADSGADLCGCMPYAMGFLGKTSNFQRSQKVFPAQTSFNSAVVLPTKNSQLGGILSAPKVLVSLGNGQLALGSQNPYYINPADPIRDLASKNINVHLTFVTEDLKRAIEQSGSKFYFMIRERFWFDEVASQAFYEEIKEHVMIKVGDGSFKKPEPQAVFLLSPHYLLERVKEECQQVLMRGYIYENRPIDLAFIKELHKNTADFLKESKISGEQFKQALVVADRKARNINLPTKPMLFYQAFMNDKDSVEVLSPYLYIPVAMINEVRAQRGGLIKTNVLLILPEDLTPKELVSLVEDRPILKDTLIQFFDNNPNATKYLTDKALAQKTVNQASRQMMVREQPRDVAMAAGTGTNNAALSQGGVTIGGTVQSTQLGVVARGKVTVTGNLEATNALLASLYDDVHVKSLIERHGRDSENFDEVLVRATVHAQNLLQIFAGQNVIFEGAETDSKVKTEVIALASILDLPVALLHQRVQHFYGKTHGTTKDIYVEQSSSSHKSGGDILMAAKEKAELYAPKFTAEKLQVIGGQSAAILDVTEQRIHEEQFASKTDTWYGGSSTKSSSMASSVASSKGAEINVKQLEIAAGEDGIKLRNTTSTAERNLFYTPDGEVEFLAGREDFSSSSSSSSSNPFWTESGSTTVQRTSWSGCSISGQVEIHAIKVTLEMVRGTTSDLLQKIEQGLDGRGTITCILKEEYCSIESDYHEAPGPALIGLVALATSIVTYGTCTTWAVGLGLAKGTVECAIATAGFSSLCSQAAAQIVANNGDPLKAIKALASQDTAKSLAVSMITAGALHKACELLKIPELGERKIFGHMQYNLARASVSATLNMSINKRDPEQALLDGLVDAAIGTALAPITCQIDDWHNLGEISAINHKIVHGVIGAARGALWHDGAIAGALEGVTGAVLHDVFDEKRPAKRELSKKAATSLLSDEPESTRELEQGKSEKEEKGKEKVSNTSASSASSEIKPSWYKLNFPDLEDLATTYRAGVLAPPSTSTTSESRWQKFKENYFAVTNGLDPDALMYNLQSQQMAQLYDDYQVGTRMGSVIQAGFGVGQLGAAAVLAQTGVGIVPACLLAARGSDNLVTGGIGFVTGQDRPTMLHQAMRGVGFSDTTARWAEFGADLSPMASGMAREAGNIAKGGMLKLYDLRIAKQAKSFTISASSPGEIFHGYGELSARQTRHLSELSMPGEMMNIFKSDINITDLASLTAKTGDEFYMFTLGSRRIIARGYSDKFYFDKKIVDRLTKEGWRLSAHTHPGTSNKVLMSSGADRYALKILGQDKSVIANSSGKLGLFTKEGIDTDLSSTIFKLSSLKPQL